MADVVVTVTVRLESPETNAEKAKEGVVKAVEALGGQPGNEEIRELAFGLKEIIINYYWPEDKGSPDEIEKTGKAVEGVQSVSVTNVTRALG